MFGCRCTLFFAFLLTLAFAACAQKHTPGIHDGCVDLSAVDLSMTPSIDLRGDWAFRWMDLVDPKRSGSVEWSKHPVPGVWGGGASPGRTGFATYRLSVIPPSRGGDDLALSLPSINSPFTVFIDDVPAFGSGIAATDLKHSMLRFIAPAVLELPDTDGRPLQILIQMSSFTQPGGFRDSPRLGSRVFLDRQASVSRRVFPEWRVAVLLGCLFACFFMVAATLHVRRRFGLIGRVDSLVVAKYSQSSSADWIARISHKWKQPLNVLGLVFQSMEIEGEETGLKPASVARFATIGMEQVQTMSAIIDSYKERP
jgi:hypothetical protein